MKDYTEVTMSPLRQRFYLWRKFRGVKTKRILAKELRARLSAMSLAEQTKYLGDPLRKGPHLKKKLEERNRRERLMIVSILGDMYKVSIFHVLSDGVQTSFYRRYA